MPLDPQAEQLLQQISELGLSPLPSLAPAQAREQVAKLRGKPLRVQPVDRVENFTIPGLSGEIPIRTYAPSCAPESSTPLPVLVYFHGGGWVLGDLDAADPTCRFLANRAGCAVVSVDYRLAPEHKFPAAVEDAFAAVEWVAQNAEKIGGDRNRVGAGGDSAGGNLAAAVALMARDKHFPALTCQLLIYPVTCYRFDTASYREFGTGNFGLSTEEMIWFWHHYLASEADGQNYYASPLLANNLSGLPKACIVTAECDVLRDEAEAYAARLREAGVSVKLKRYDGLIHSFVGLASVLDRGKEALGEIADELRRMFSSVKSAEF